MSILTNSHDSRLFEFAYIFAYRSLLLLLFIHSFFCRNISSKKSFVLMDLRLSSYNRSKLQIFRVGPFFSINSTLPSIYRTITRRRRVQVFFKSIFLYFKAKNELRSSCDKNGVDFNDFNKKIGFSFVRYLDINLAYCSLGELEHAETAGHFDVYTAIISILREENRIASTKLYQHGLYEQFDFNGFKWGLYSDQVVLRYVESKQYFLSCLNRNPSVKVDIAATSFMPAFHIGNDVNGLKIAYALQNDCYAQDFANIQDIILVAPHANLLLYLHPATPQSMVEGICAKFPMAKVFTKERHDDIDYVISRYSSLVVDYAEIGIRGIFMCSTDKVCAFESAAKRFDVVYNLDQLRDIL